MSRLQEEGSYVSLGNGEWARRVTNATGSSLGTSQSGATAVGNGTSISTRSLDYVAVNVRGITTATLTFQASISGEELEWDDVPAKTMATNERSTTTTGNGNFLVNVAGYRYFRTKITSYSAGTITATAYSYSGSGWIDTYAVNLTRPSFENQTDGIARIQEKKVLSATLPPLDSFSLFNDVDISAKAGGGNVYSVVGTNINAAVRYLQLFNKASAPAAAEVPYRGLSFPMVQNQTLVVGEQFFSSLGMYFPTGIAWGFSTTAATFTAATTTDHSGNLRYM